MTTRSGKNIEKIPEPTLRRLPWYLSGAKLMRERGERYISSTRLSEQINIDASQIAKDLSFVNISGRTRVGYEIDSLIRVLEDFLGFTRLHKAYLSEWEALEEPCFVTRDWHSSVWRLWERFDVNPELVGTSINGIPIYHTDEFTERIRQDGVCIGVLTVPISIAQEVTDRMVDGGIRAVWNFTPFRIRVPEHIVVQNTSLYAHLAVMFNRLNETLKK